MADFMRSPTYEAIKLAAAPSGGLESGDFYKTEDTVGVVLEDADAGAPAVLIYECSDIVVPKKTGSGKSFAVGDKVFYDSAAGDVTPTSASGLFLIGIAVRAATAAATTVNIHLRGQAVTAI